MAGRIADSVTVWLDLKAGDLNAAEKLWRRYFEDLVRLARAGSAPHPRPWPMRRMRPSTPSTASSGRCTRPLSPA